MLSNTLWNKVAETEQPLEQALADLAYAQASARAPKLFRYAVAFQALDQSEDRQKAVGLFGFKVGNRWLRVPVFYRNGEITGTELLMPGPRTFVPLSDEWVNYFIDGGSKTAGRPIDKQTSRTYASPNLWQLRAAPTKWAKDTSGLVTPEVLKALAKVKFAVEDEFEKKAAAGVDLFEAISDQPHMLQELGRMCTKFAWFGDAVLKYHGKEKVAAALAAYKSEALTGKQLLRNENNKKIAGLFDAASPAADIPRNNKLTVIRARHTQIISSSVDKKFKMSVMDRITIGNGDNVYKDERQDEYVTNVIAWPGRGQRNTPHNPSRSITIGDVVTESGDCERCLVATALVTPLEPLLYKCLVVRLSDGAFTLADRRNVWLSTEEDDQAVNSWLNGLPDANAASGISGWNVLVDSGKKVSAPFYAWSSGSNETSAFARFATVDGQLPHYSDPESEESKYYKGDSIAGADPALSYHFQPRKLIGGEEHACAYSSTRIASTKVDLGSLFASNHTLYYPRNTKVFKIKNTASFRLGLSSKALDVAPQIKEASVLTVRTDANRYLIIDEKTGFTKEAVGKDGEADLVEYFGLRVPDAQKLIKMAEDKRKASVVVKYAAGVQTLVTGGPNAPPVSEFDQLPHGTGSGFADDIVPSKAPITAGQVVTDMLPTADQQEAYRAYPTDAGVTSRIPGIGNSSDQGPPSGPENDPELLQTLHGAAQSGRKDLFDTAAFASLIKYTTVDTVLSRLLPGMFSQTSKLGETLAHMYWNRDHYEERFGRTEITALLDRIRGQFEGMGGLYLKLKEKSGGQLPGASILPEIDSSDDSGTDVSQ